ncbi:MAG: murein biosynthesis integral membrane protein MurJ [Paraclostridium sordellii]
MPSVLFSAVAAAIATTFIPLYYENDNLGKREDALKFTNNVLNIVMVTTLILALMSSIFAIGFAGETLEITVYFTRIMVFSIVFLGLSNIMTSFLQVNNNFILPGLIGVPLNIIIIISIILSVKYNPYILPIGTLIAMVSQFLFKIPFAKKVGYKYKPVRELSDKYIKKMVWLVGPVFIGVAVNQINAMIDRTLASTLQAGSISALNYANRLNNFVMGLFIMSIAAVIYPILSKLSTENDKTKFYESVRRSINTVILLEIPISVGAIVLANPIVSVLFKRGEFDEKATRMTAIALIFYSIGMVAFGLRYILGKVFYSLQETKTPMINGAIAMILNIALNLVLVRFMGYAGLAFATSISSIICIFLLFRSSKKKIGYFGQDKIINSIVKALISATVMGIATFFTYKILLLGLGLGFLGQIISLFGSICIGAIIYSILVVILKVEEVNIVYNLIKNKIKQNYKI